MIAYDIEAFDEFIKNLQSENSEINRKEVISFLQERSTSLKAIEFETTVQRIVKNKGKKIQEILEDEDFCRDLAQEFEKEYCSTINGDNKIFVRLNLEIKPFNPMFNAQSFALILNNAPSKYVKKFLQGIYQLPYTLQFDVYKDGKVEFDQPSQDTFHAKFINVYGYIH